MYKKVIWSIVLIAIVGVLTYGAVNRTLAKTADSGPLALSENKGQTTEVAEGRGLGRGQTENAGQEAEHESEGEGFGNSQAAGQGQGRNQNQNATTESQQGQGQGRNQNRQVEQEHEELGEAEHEDEAKSWQGQGQGRNQNRQAEQAAVAEAEHADMAWQTVQGEVVSLMSDIMIVETASGATVLVEGQPWSYAQEAGFMAEPGDAVTVHGFEEDGEFKVGELMNDSSGQIVVLRELSGRPMWAGRGQGKNRN